LDKNSSTSTEKKQYNIRKLYKQSTCDIGLILSLIEQQLQLIIENKKGESNLAINSIAVNWGFGPPNFPFPWGIWAPRLIQHYLGPRRCPCQMASHSAQAQCISVSNNIQRDRWINRTIVACVALGKIAA